MHRWVHYRTHASILSKITIHCTLLYTLLLAKYNTMFATLGRRTALLATRRAAATTANTQKRRMGGAAAPEWTGIDKVVRGYFPQDDQREFFYCARSDDYYEYLICT